MATVSVLCSRVRMEEKQIIAALAEVGVSALQLDPCRAALPIGPVPSRPFAEKANGVATDVIIDRCQDRTVAVAALHLFEVGQSIIFDAGIASTRDRLAVAAALSAAGIARPVTQLVCSEESALVAVNELGYPSVLLPLMPDTEDIVLLDRDTAEAVFEHRHVLGRQPEAIGLVQQGCSLAAPTVTIVVINGTAVAVGQDTPIADVSDGMIRLAEAAARALHASIVGIELALTHDGPVVWDVQPVPEFRNMHALGSTSVADALATMIASRISTTTSANHASLNGATNVASVETGVSRTQEVTKHVALLA